MKIRSVLHVIQALFLSSLITPALAQEVTIPDVGLNAAIRAALQKPSGPLTEQDLLGLTNLDASSRNISNVAGLEAARNLTALELSNNHLQSLTLPAGLTNLASLVLSGNQLTNLTLSSDQTHLASLDLGGNNLTSLTLPAGLTNLVGLFVADNPLATLVLSEPMAATNLAGPVALLREQGVSVFTYPLTVQLIRLREPIGAFQFAIIGPPGVYTVLSSTNLAAWSTSGVTVNGLGSVVFTDGGAHLSPQKFYRALLQSSPANMVFIPPNTFTLGSPSNEVGRALDEGPQTIVTLTHGFWISKFLVTQQDYLAVIGSNPSSFPGDLSRPVESVTWLDATNYCAKLTQQDLAAGRIPPGSHYRLPTEAEWECAARAGTSTRFNYGDDPGVTSLTNHAWYGANSGLVTHPVGQKEPNAWGLYDMEGNVWEWCQDWYGPYPGGSETDPQGPAANPIGFKVIRGGAWEAFEFDCRSARRSIEPASPFISDYIIGFRVVLDVGP